MLDKLASACYITHYANEKTKKTNRKQHPIPAVIRKKVYAAFNSGQTKYAAGMKYHIHERTVGRWYAKFAEHGIEAIHGRKRGPKPGGGKHKLSDLQLADLKRIITDRTLDQLKFKFALWSSKAVKELVSRKYGAQISRLTARR